MWIKCVDKKLVKVQCLKRVFTSMEKGRFHMLMRVFSNVCKYNNNNNNNSNLLLGSSITKSGLHRGPNTRYILYNDTIKI